MDKKEIINYIKEQIKIDKDTRDFFKNDKRSSVYIDTDKSVQALTGILKLYKAEENKNTSLKKEIKLMKSININENYISKAELTVFINNELKMIEYNKGKMDETLLSGLEAAYRCIKEFINNR